LLDYGNTTGAATAVAARYLGGRIDQHTRLWRARAQQP
jgi:hypothetical protein